MLGSGNVLPGRRRRAPIALEFMIVYSFVLVIFMILFVLVVNQRSLSLNQQEYSSLQLVTQNIANYINQALSSGNGYNATVLIPGEIGTAPYTIEVSSSGVVIANLTIGKKSAIAYAFSRARSLQVGGSVAESANGITVYKIKNIGQVSIANSHGTIYVDKNITSTVPLTNLFVTIPESGTKMAEFKNNAATGSYSSNTYVQAYAPSIAGSNVPFTATMWIYVPASSNSNMPFFGMNSYQAFELFRSGLGTSTNQLFLHRCSNADTGESTIPAMAYNTWHFVAVSVNPPNYQFQLDGSNSVTTNTWTYNDNGYITIGAQAAQCDGTVYVGDIANVQLYKTALSASQLNALYMEGVDAPPAQSADLVGWWPLNGNTNDYSGNGYTGTPSNITYGSLAQLEARAVLGNGGTNIDSLIGMIANNGTFNQSGKGNVALYSNSSGYVKTFLTGGNVSNIAVDSYAFNGNQSTVGNLVGWWPLVLSASAVSNTIYDLSSNYNNGNFNNVVWNNYSASTTNFLTANFNGTSTVSTGMQLSPQNFTITMWVNPANAVKMESANGYTLMNTLGSNEIQIWLNNGGGAGAAAGSGDEELGIGSNYYHGYGINNNTWSFLAFSVNSGNVSFYANGQGPYSVTGVLSPTYSLNNMSFGESAAGISQYSGYMSNVQVYSKSLSAAQVSQIYAGGVNGIPLQGNTILKAWWPLAGDTNSYALNPASTTASNVVFTNSNYGNNYSSGERVAYFNGAADAQTGITGLPTGSAARTLVAWVKISSYSNGGCGQEMALGYGPASGGTAEVVGLGPTLGGNVGFASNGNDYISPLIVPLNDWTFIAASYEAGSTSATVYMNGQSSSGSLSSGLPLNTPASGISSYVGAWGAGGCKFTGQIAGAQVYNTNLTSVQVSQLYQEGLSQMVYKNLTFG